MFPSGAYGLLHRGLVLFLSDWSSGWGGDVYGEVTQGVLVTDGDGEGLEPEIPCCQRRESTRLGTSLSRRPFSLRPGPCVVVGPSGVCL